MKRFNHIVLICLYTAAGILNIAGRGELSSANDNSISVVNASARNPVLTRVKSLRQLNVSIIPEIDYSFNTSSVKAASYLPQTGIVCSYNIIQKDIFYGYLTCNKAPPVA